MATEFKLPEVGEGIESGVVVGLLVSAGDKVEKDQPVLELETDKAVVEVPSAVSGVVQAVHVQENDEVKIGQLLLTVAAEAEADAVPVAAAEPKVAPAEAKPTAEIEGAEAPLKEPARIAAAKPPAPKSSERVLIPAAPSVRRLAREKGVDMREVSGSGILGRISPADVIQHVAGGQVADGLTAPAAPPLPDFSVWGELERQPMKGIRKATVRSMSNAWATVPMVTQFDKADVTEFEQLRKKYQAKAEASGAKLTPTAMIIKIVAGALRKFPDFNASIDVAAGEIIYKKYVNIGVAVDTDNGLLVPVIKNADRKNMLDLAKELGELAEKARMRKLSPDDMQGGNFSVSNLGGIGGTNFTPIVNPPDVAILGVSRGSYEPVYNRESGEFEPRLLMPLSLSYDHRLIDGAAAARFLRWICQAIEEPFLMPLEG